MDLIISPNRPLNATLCDADGKAFYITRTPPGLMTNTTTLYRVLPEYPDDRKSDFASAHDDGGDESDDELPGDDERRLGVGMEEVAKLHWKMKGSSVIEYRGKELDCAEYFQREGNWGFDRSFTASDGKSYRWVAALTTYTGVALFRNDEAKTPIARHFRSNSGLIGPKRKAHVKIFPEGMSIIDDVMVTFLYMYRVRRSLLEI